MKDGGRHLATDWDTALARFAQLVRAGSGKTSAVILASGSAALEALGMVKRLLSRFDLKAAVRIPTGSEAPLEGVPNLALRKERAANGAGARLLGYDTDFAAALKAAGSAALVVLLDVELSEAEAGLLGGAAGLVVLGTVAQELRSAQLILPVTTMVEENGTFVNRDGRVQRFLQARVTPGMARPAWWVAAETEALAGAKVETPTSADEAFAQVASMIPSLAGLTYRELGLSGRAASPVGAGA